MKVQCVTSSGLIRMTAVGGVSLLEVLATHSDKTSRRLSTIIMV